MSELAPYFDESDPNEADLMIHISTATNRPMFVLLQLERAIVKGLNAAYEMERKESRENDLGFTNATPKYIEKAYLDAFEMLSNQVALCERVVKQPVPLSYSRHTSRFLSVYLFSLPFSLLPDTGWLTVVIVTIIAWSFLSIQEIGHFIEQPFDKTTQMISLTQMVGVVCSDGVNHTIFLSFFCSLVFLLLHSSSSSIITKFSHL